MLIALVEQTNWKKLYLGIFFTLSGGYFPCSDNSFKAKKLLNPWVAILIICCATPA
jgi:hypothetical protein